MGELAWLVHFGQADPTGGLSTYTQIGQLGATGAMIVMFAYTVLHHNPKQIKEERESRERIFKEEHESRERIALAEQQTRRAVAKRHARVIRTILTETKEQAKYEREACDKRHRELVEMTERHNREQSDAADRRYEDVVKRMEAQYLLDREIKHTVANLAQSEASRREVEKLQKRKNSPGERVDKS